MRLSFLAAAAALALMAPVGAQAAAYVDFNGICASTATATQAACTSTNGTYGNSATLTSTNDSTLKVMITAWQVNQSNNAVTSAFLGAYSGGFGVTGLGDNNGADGKHQIDNVGGYTDFVMLQFSRAVHLETATFNLYQITGVSGMDSDASTYNLSAMAPTTWNSSLNLTGAAGTNNPSSWANTSVGDAVSGSQNLNATAGFSKVWLLSASQLTTDRNDGFKLAALSVTPQVIALPEPGTWGMLIFGFGGIGLLQRRRRAHSATPAAA